MKKALSTPNELDEHYLRRELYELVRTDPMVFDFLQAGSLDGMWFWDLEKPENEWMSESFWTLLGFEPGQKAHSAAEWREHIDPGDLKRSLENYAKHRADPSHPYDQIVRYRHQNESTVWVRCRGIAIRDENGLPIRMLGVHNDITELMHNREQLTEDIVEIRNLSQQLDSTKDEMAAFTYAVSHDLMEPLLSISDLADFLLEDLRGNVSNESLQYLMQMQEKVSTTQKLIDDLLNFARSGHEDSTPATIQLREFIEGICNRLEIPSTFKIRVASNDTLSIYSRAAPLRQVLESLIDNAVRHHDQTVGTVDVSWKRIGNRVEFTVTDDGPGIPRQHHLRIFDVFQKLSSNRHEQNTGMGLAIVSKLVRMYGGHINVESGLSRQRGTTFRFSWPISVKI